MTGFDPLDVENTVRNPDSMTRECAEHVFYTKEIPGKGNMIVYAKMTGEKSLEVQCIGWLIKPQKGVVN